MTVPAQGFVRRRQADGVATVELVNAKSMNILGSAAIEELTDEFRRLAREEDCRVVVLRGAGEKAFIGGADINEMAGLDQAAAEAFISGLAALCEAVRACPAPVIARLSGWCLGAGLEVAVSCDLRVAGAGATFGMPQGYCWHSVRDPRCPYSCHDRRFPSPVAAADRRDDRRRHSGKLGTGPRRGSR